MAAWWHAEVKGAYGSRRIYRALRERKLRIGRRRVERLMRLHGIRARHKCRFKVTTDSAHAQPVAPNLLARQFKPVAPNRAYTRRKPEAGGLFHSDRGSQYASRAVRAVLSEYSLQASMSRKGNCWDNAPTESFFNSLKNERVYGQKIYATRAEAKAYLFEYIEVFYNRTRLHSSLNYQSPLHYLENWDNQPKQAA